MATIIMKHEGFDFTMDVWDEKVPKSDQIREALLKQMLSFLGVYLL